MTAPTTITQTLPLPWLTPPLNANDRMHWRPKANIIRDGGRYARARVFPQLLWLRERNWVGSVELCPLHRA